MAVLMRKAASTPICSSRPAQLGGEVEVVDTSRRLADVHHQIGRPLQFAHDTQRSEQESEVTGHGRLERQQSEALLLDLQAGVVDDVVAVDQALGSGQVAVEKDGRPHSDRFRGHGSQPHQLLAELVQLVVVLEAEFFAGHARIPFVVCRAVLNRTGR